MVNPGRPCPGPFHTGCPDVLALEKALTISHVECHLPVSVKPRSQLSQSVPHMSCHTLLWSHLCLAVVSSFHGTSLQRHGPLPWAFS
jgi:hypothetical protein